MKNRLSRRLQADNAVSSESSNGRAYDRWVAAGRPRPYFSKKEYGRGRLDIVVALLSTVTLLVFYIYSAFRPFIAYKPPVVPTVSFFSATPASPVSEEFLVLATPTPVPTSTPTSTPEFLILASPTATAVVTPTATPAFRVVCDCSAIICYIEDDKQYFCHSSRQSAMCAFLIENYSDFCN